MGWQRLREATPTVAIHMAVAALHLMAIVTITGELNALFAGFVATLLLVVPMIGILAILAESPHVGTALFLLSFVGTAGVILLGHLGQGHLVQVLAANPVPVKVLFFATAVLLPLVQARGVLEAARVLFAYWDSRRSALIQVADK